MTPLSPVADGRSRRTRGSGSGTHRTVGMTSEATGDLPGALETGGEHGDSATEEIERRWRSGCLVRTARERGREGEEEEERGRGTAAGGLIPSSRERQRRPSPRSLAGIDGGGSARQLPGCLR
jgi:hypothetical protein